MRGGLSECINEDNLASFFCCCCFLLENYLHRFSSFSTRCLVSSRIHHNDTVRFHNSSLLLLLTNWFWAFFDKLFNFTSPPPPPPQQVKIGYQLQFPIWDPRYQYSENVIDIWTFASVSAGCWRLSVGNFFTVQCTIFFLLFVWSVVDTVVGGGTLSFFLPWPLLCNDSVNPQASPIPLFFDTYHMKFNLFTVSLLFFTIQLIQRQELNRFRLRAVFSLLGIFSNVLFIPFGMNGRIVYRSANVGRSL